MISQKIGKMEPQNNSPRIGTARNVARKLLTDIGINKPPVLIKIVIDYLKKTMDLSIRPWSFGEDTDGIQLTEGNKNTIGYNQSQHPHRQRFTIAHEIGHLLLGHTSGDSDFDLDSTKPEEIEANQFAAELLMPLSMLKSDLKKGLKDISVLAKIYNVSEKALWWRLLDCKLINKM